MKKVLMITILLSIFLVSLTACNHTDKELTQVNIACFPNITHAQALLMKEQGTLEEAFEKDGVTVNWMIFNAGPSEIEALFAGEVDIGFIGPVPALSGYIQSNGDLQIIAGASNGGSVLVVKDDSDIHSIGDLDGKTVAIPQFGNTQHLSLLALLTENELKPTTHGGTVSIVQSSNADITNLMERGDVDAALVPEPWGSILELNRDGRVILEYDEVDPNGIPSTAIVIVRKDFLDAFPEAVEKFIKAHKQATVYINDNTESAMGIVNTQIAKITQNLIGYDVLSSAFNRLEFSYEIHASSIMDFARIGLDENLLPRLPDSNLINESFIR